MKKQCVMAYFYPGQVNEGKVHLWRIIPENVGVRTNRAMLQARHLLSGGAGTVVEEVGVAKETVAAIQNQANFRAVPVPVFPRGVVLQDNEQDSETLSERAVHVSPLGR